MRAVIDTNILVRTLIMPHGSVGPVVQRLRRGDYTLLYSTPLLEELADVLNRPRIRDKYGLNATDIKTVLRLILLRGEPVTPAETITACRDPKDNKFLEVAIAAQADVLISRDEDLLVLHPFEGVSIISPAQFLKLLDEQDAD